MAGSVARKKRKEVIIVEGVGWDIVGVGREEAVKVVVGEEGDGGVGGKKGGKRGAEAMGEAEFEKQV